MAENIIHMEKGLQKKQYKLQQILSNKEIIEELQNKPKKEREDYVKQLLENEEEKYGRPLLSSSNASSHASRFSSSPPVDEGDAKINIDNSSRHKVPCRCGHNLKAFNIKKKRKDKSKIPYKGGEELENVCEICEKKLDRIYKIKSASGEKDTKYDVYYVCVNKKCYFLKAMDDNDDGMIQFCELCAYQTTTQHFVKDNYYPILIPLTVLPLSLMISVVHESLSFFIYVPFILNILFYVYIFISSYIRRVREEEYVNDSQPESLFSSWDIKDQFHLLSAKNTKGKTNSYLYLYMYWFYFCSAFLSTVPLLTKWTFQIPTLLICHHDTRITEDDIISSTTSIPIDDEWEYSLNELCSEYRSWLGCLNVVFIAYISIGIVFSRNLKLKVADAGAIDVFLGFVDDKYQNDDWKKTREKIQSVQKAHDARSTGGFWRIVKMLVLSCYLGFIACAEQVVLGTQFVFLNFLSSLIGFTEIILSFFTMMMVIIILDRICNIYRKPLRIMQYFSLPLEISKYVESIDEWKKKIESIKEWWEARTDVLDYELPQYYQYGNASIGCLIGSSLILMSTWMFRLIEVSGNVQLLFYNIFASNLVFVYFLLTPIVLLGTTKALTLITKPYTEQRNHVNMIQNEILKLKYGKVKNVAINIDGGVKNVAIDIDGLIEYLEDTVNRMQNNERRPVVLGIRLTSKRVKIIKGYMYSIMVGLVAKIIYDFTAQSYAEL